MDVDTIEQRKLLEIDLNPGYRNDAKIKNTFVVKNEVVLDAQSS